MPTLPLTAQRLARSDCLPIEQLAYDHATEPSAQADLLTAEQWRRAQALAHRIGRLPARALPTPTPMHPVIFAACASTGRSARLESHHDTLLANGELWRWPALMQIWGRQGEAAQTVAYVHEPTPSIAINQARLFEADLRADPDFACSLLVREAVKAMIFAHYPQLWAPYQAHVHQGLNFELASIWQRADVRLRHAWRFPQGFFEAVLVDGMAAQVQRAALQTMDAQRVGDPAPGHVRQRLWRDHMDQSATEAMGVALFDALAHTEPRRRVRPARAAWAHALLAEPTLLERIVPRGWGMGWGWPAPRFDFSALAS